MDIKGVIMPMKITSWGKYPSVEADIKRPHSSSELKSDSSYTIARGLGRSYGDSALSEHITLLDKMDRFKAFNPESGLLTCDAGVSLANILSTFVPQGWFLPVTPGTKFVTVGGAIASDVHGKNHHCQGLQVNV